MFMSIGLENVDFKQIVVICISIVDEILSVYPNYSTLHSRNTCI